MTNKSLLSQHWKVVGRVSDLSAVVSDIVWLADTWQQGTHCTLQGPWRRHRSQMEILADICSWLGPGLAPGDSQAHFVKLTTIDPPLLSHTFYQQPRHASWSIEDRAIIKLGLCDKFERVHDPRRWDQKSCSFEFEYYISLLVYSHVWLLVVGGGWVVQLLLFSFNFLEMVQSELLQHQAQSWW